MTDFKSKTLSFNKGHRQLNFSGERYTTTMTGSIEQEHRHRYLVALSHCTEKRVLDIASGEGYGSSMLANVAAHVTGVDISQEAVDHANSSYKKENLEFIQGSATQIPLDDNSIDVLVSFETIEHFVGHEKFLQEIKRVLVPGGLCIISSPNKEVYSETPDNHNEFHVSELFRDEFIDLLSSHFENIKHLEQKATSASIIVPTDPSSSMADFRSFRRIDAVNFEKTSGTIGRGVYSMVFASDTKLPKRIQWGVLEDEDYQSNLFEIIKYNEALLLERDEELNKCSNITTFNENLIAEQKDKISNNENTIQSLNRAMESKQQKMDFLLDLVDKNQREFSALQAERNNVVLALENTSSALNAMKQSTIWRVSAPYRKCVEKLNHIYSITSKQARRAKARLQESGFKNTLTLACKPGMLKAFFFGNEDFIEEKQAIPSPTQSLQYGSPPTPNALKLLSPKVVIIAEMSIPQCTKYRVWQKAYHFDTLGIPVVVLDWSAVSQIRSALQTATIAIWYRVPGYDASLELIEEAKKLGIATFWEVDDLIFDRDTYLQNKNLDRLSPQLRKSVLDGVPLYRKALESVDYGIASTPVLREQMLKAGVKDAYVVQNCLDPETLSAARRARSIRKKTKQETSTVNIVYGSGSKSHDADFQCAANGIAYILEKYPNVSLTIVGELTLPKELEVFSNRVTREVFTSFSDYLTILAQSDISLAPLEDSIFNHAKSNIKYLEAAILALPCVCSKRDAFEHAIVDGENAFLASNDNDWKTKLELLVISSDLRKSMGIKALKSVRTSYSQKHIARSEVLPLTKNFTPQTRTRPSNALKVLSANIYFAPKSFGGATIVAEEVTQRLSKFENTDMGFFSSLVEQTAAPYSLRRYEAKGATCFAVQFPHFNNQSLEYKNPDMQVIFNDVLNAYQPDIVHLHSIQGLSASLARACVEADIPFVITPHDAWWLCEKQFMVNHKGKYCFQYTIDLKECAKCVPDFSYTTSRNIYLDNILSKASLVLAPSDFQRKLYVNNGVMPNKARTWKNGVNPPKIKASIKNVEDKIRFGYVGGNGPLKGLNLILKAFKHISQSNYELIIVDNTQNLGYSSFGKKQKEFPPQTKLVPAYTQENIDKFFEGIDVLLFPSQIKESFGLTVREALIRNVWVISTDAGGAAEDIIEGENGNIIPLHNTPSHTELKQAIENLLSNPKKLDGYSNPYSDQITTFDDQATELRKILLDAVKTHKNNQKTHPI